MSSGPWIQTFTGRRVFLANPDEGQIDIVDIAHALARLCRYTGHTSRHYSIAEHSVHVCHQLPGPLAFDGLMHDAAEAYLGDVSAPLKSLLPDFRRIEKHMESVIARKFGLATVLHRAVKEADLRMLFTEREQLLPDRLPWDGEDDFPPYALDLSAPCEAADAERMFLDEFRGRTT